MADFAYITDNTYTKEQMIQMEEIILKRLSYELTVPTAKAFLRRLLQVGPRACRGGCWPLTIIVHLCCVPRGLWAGKGRRQARSRAFPVPLRISWVPAPPPPPCLFSHVLTFRPPFPCVSHRHFALPTTTTSPPQVCNPDEELHFLSNYLTELSLLDHTMLSFLPSEIAAAAVFLAHVLLRRQPWDATLQYYSKYAPRDLEPCVHALAALHGSMGASTNNLAALREKYGAPRFHSVSRHVQPLASVPDMYFR